MVRLSGHVTETEFGFRSRPGSQKEECEMGWMHPAVLFAREKDIDIIMAPISLFSDETSGNVSKLFNKYETCSIAFSNMSRECRAKNLHSYIILTSNGL
jgi:hypothetical protein